MKRIDAVAGYLVSPRAGSIDQSPTRNRRSKWADIDGVVVRVVECPGVAVNVANPWAEPCADGGCSGSNEGESWNTDAETASKKELGHDLKAERGRGYEYPVKPRFQLAYQRAMVGILAVVVNGTKER